MTAAIRFARDRQFAEGVRIALGQVDNDKFVIDHVLDNLRRDHAGLVDLVLSGTWFGDLSRTMTKRAFTRGLAAASFVPIRFRTTITRQLNRFVAALDSVDCSGSIDARQPDASR